MQDIAILLLILTVIVAGCLIPVILGVLISKRLKKTNPNSVLLKPQTPIDLVFAAVGTLVLLVAMAAYKLALGGMLGSFLNQPYGLIAAILIFLVAAYILGFIFAAAVRYFWLSRKRGMTGRGDR